MVGRTYEQKLGPKPVSFEDYARTATAEYVALLGGNPSEAAVQSFLEQNPTFVPGAWTPGGGSGHGPWNHFLVSQPVLPGLATRRPDFMWLAQHSDTWFPTLVEIESPAKRLFRADNQPTAEFTQARNQLTEWKAWFAQPENVMKFIADYRLSPTFVNRRVQPAYILVLGRRAEFESDPARTRARAQLMGPDEELFSFDRLAPAPQLEDALTVVPGVNGKWRARGVAPSFGLVPPSADRLLIVEGLEEVIRARTGITAERSEFLAERIDYWRRWEASQSAGLRIYDPWELE